MMHVAFSREISAWTREMSAPGSRRSVSLRRPMVKSGLSIGTMRRPSASVTTSRGAAISVIREARALYICPRENHEVAEDRPFAGHARLVDSAHAGVGRHARLGHLATPAAAVARRPAGHEGIAL